MHDKQLDHSTAQVKFGFNIISIARLGWVKTMFSCASKGVGIFFFFLFCCTKLYKINYTNTK